MARRRRRRGSSLTYIKKEKKFKISYLYDILTWIFGSLVSIFLAVAVVYAFGSQMAVAGSSMEPNLSNGQVVMLNKLVYQFSAPKRGDVIAFRPNGNENERISIKRVIGVPGDDILISNGKVSINGELFVNDYCEETSDGGVASEGIHLNADEYFVMGDNRLASEDSRNANIGNVSRGMIVGKCWYHFQSDKAGRGKIE